MKHSPQYTAAQNGSLAILILMLGVMTGFFWTYSFNVNVAMLQVSGEYYATMQSLFNVTVRNIMFFSVFFGSGLFGVLAILVNLKHRRTISFWLITVATLTYILGIIVFTKEVNLPLNYYTESWNPQNLPADWQSVRDQWNQANMIRVGTSFISFLLAVLALFSRSLSK
jgi:uncharacterized membrane protein